MHVTQKIEIVIDNRIFNDIIINNLWCLRIILKGYLLPYGSIKHTVDN